MKRKQRVNLLSWRVFKTQLPLQLAVLMGMTVIVVFTYLPMSGILIAFKDYRSSMGFAGFFTAPWTSNHGFRHFLDFFHDPWFGLAMRNTLGISLLKLLFSFPAPIILALALNELRHNRFKRVVQTVSYLPHFISWVVVYGLVFTFLNTQTGFINRLFVSAGIWSEPHNFLANEHTYWTMAVITDVWKELGWWSIIFLAAMSGIDPAMYEAAKVDGANRWRCIWHITLPGIMSTVMVLLILALGALFSGGMGGSNFDQTYLMGNSVNYPSSMTIGYYAYQTGLLNQRYSYATAVGLFQSVVSIILVAAANWGSRRLTGNSIF